LGEDILFVVIHKSQGDRGHIRLAGNWLKLDLAEDSWKLGEFAVESLTSQGTFLKGASTDRWLWDAGKLNGPLLDGKGLGQAGLDHLLGDAELGGLLLNNVHHSSWPGQKRNALVQLGDWCWDNYFTWALGNLTGKFCLKGRWQARAVLKTRLSSRLVQHEGEGSQTWPQNAHARGLEVSRALTIHVTTKTDCARLEEPWSNNFNP